MLGDYHYQQYELEHERRVKDAQDRALAKSAQKRKQTQRKRKQK